MTKSVSASGKAAYQVRRGWRSRLLISSQEAKKRRERPRSPSVLWEHVLQRLRSPTRLHFSPCPSSSLGTRPLKESWWEALYPLLSSGWEFYYMGTSKIHTSWPRGRQRESQEKWCSCFHPVAEVKDTEPKAASTGRYFSSQCQIHVRGVEKEVKVARTHRS